MNQQFSKEISWEIHECLTCHTLFAIPTVVNHQLRQSHERFVCPFGHGHSYPQKSDKEILQEQVVTLENKLNQCHNRTEFYSSRNSELHSEIEDLKKENRGLKISRTKLKKKLES